MIFDDNSQWSYQYCQLREVICQLRFPTILSINENPPADFQDAIRESFPSYSLRQERPPAKVVGLGTPNAKVEQSAVVNNYNFVSSTGIWKINLTQNFIAISTLRYNSWEDLAQRLDQPLAEFIRIYRPAYFERIGLRYLNVFSRQNLALEDTPWRELIDPAYLGILADPDVEERNVGKCSLETEMRFPDGVHMKIHSGPGMLKQGNGQPDPEPKFILDIDCASNGQIAGEQVPTRLSEIHDHALRAFRGAITPALHEAMGGEPR